MKTKILTKNTKIVIAYFVVLIAVITVFIPVSKTSAKYSSEISGGGSYSVAKPVFKVEFTDVNVNAVVQAAGGVKFLVKNYNADGRSETSFSITVLLKIPTSITALTVNKLFAINQFDEVLDEELYPPLPYSSSYVEGSNTVYVFSGADYLNFGITADEIRYFSVEILAGTTVGSYNGISIEVVATQID